MRNLRFQIGSGLALAFVLAPALQAQPQRAAGPSSTRSAVNTTKKAPAPAPRRFSPSYGGSVGSGGPGPSGGRRKPTRNNSAVISPYLNLDPSFVNSEAGQFLTRTLPQMELTRNQGQTQQGFQNLQGEISQVETDYKSGLGTTGHTTVFGNTAGYYPGR